MLLQSDLYIDYHRTRLRRCRKSANTVATGVRAQAITAAIFALMRNSMRASILGPYSLSRTESKLLLRSESTAKPR